MVTRCWVATRDPLCPLVPAPKEQGRRDKAQAGPDRGGGRFTTGGEPTGAMPGRLVRAGRDGQALQAA